MSVRARQVLSSPLVWEVRTCREPTTFLSKTCSTVRESNIFLSMSVRARQVLSFPLVWEVKTCRESTTFISMSVRAKQLLSPP